MRIPSPCVHKPALALIATPTADLNRSLVRDAGSGAHLYSVDDSDSRVRLTGRKLSGWTCQRDVGPWRSGTATVSQINWARGGEPYDNRPLEGVATLERAFAGGTAHRVGWYRFYFSDERWEWSPEVEQIHGYQPGTVTPTTQLVLSHKHPDDYAYIAATLDDIRQSHRPFSTRHRIITLQGATRDIVVIGERLHDNSGEVIGTQGFYIDVTRSDEAREATISEAVAEFAEHRAAIEQAKGVLMYIYRIDSAAAFDLLKWRSQETNTKLRTLAEQLLADVHALKQNDSPDRATFDRLLLTAHQRVKANAAHDPGTSVQ
jgi:PAS domain S-box-containing protein